MIALLDHLADPGESLEAAELHAPQGNAVKCGITRPVSSPTERTSYLKVRSERH
jgi:hypothetical protein